MTRLSRFAVVSLSILFLYYEIYRWIPLGLWNGEPHWPVRNDQFYPDIAIGIFLIWMLWSFARQKTMAIGTAAVLLTTWAVLHAFSWWIPYLRGTGSERTGFYQFYASRIQLLPSVGNHHPPDGGHAVLDFFVFASLVLCLLVFFQRIRTPK